MTEARITSYIGGLVTEGAVLRERQGWEANDFFGEGRPFGISHSPLPSGPICLYESSRKFGAIPPGETYNFEGFDTEGKPMTITVAHQPHTLNRSQLKLIK